jgi:manganese/zinc/iron transport system permease protein
MIGDVIAHSSLPGIAFAFLIVLEKNTILLLFSAILAGLIAAFCINLIKELTNLPEDTVLAVILSSFFGLGWVFLSVIQNLNILSQSGLEHYLVGNIAFLLLNDLVFIVGFSFLLLIFLLLFWKEFKLITLDPIFAKSLGFKVSRYDHLLLILTITAVIVGVELIGTVMIAALLIGPAIISRHWFDDFQIVVLNAGIFGALSGLIGSIISREIPNTPPGPMIIIVLGMFLLFSVTFAPKKGIVWKANLKQLKKTFGWKK